MKKYEVVFGAGVKIEMTHAELQDFLAEIAKGSEVVEFKGNFLTKFFRVIVPKQITEGRLHDGTKVVKQNGQWVDAVDRTLRLDPNYYPEIVKDEVLSEEDWLKNTKLLSP